MQDTFGREINYMRISVTDRCNLSCRYCMPEDVCSVPKAEILTYEEIVRVAKAGVGLGIHHLKVTGGEPLVRKGCPALIQMLKEIPGIQTVTVTTNGICLEEHLEALQKAGVDGINISLDTLNAASYAKLTGADKLNEVLNGILAAVTTKIPVKINAVSIPEIHEESYLELVELAQKHPIDVRFIEMMPIGYGKKYQSMSHEQLRAKIHQKYPGMVKDTRKHGFGPAVYEQIPGFQGSIGFISALHGKFCKSCNRIRLTAQGYLKSCLCYEEGEDLRQILRNGGDVAAAMEAVIHKKPSAHCFENPERMTEQCTMQKIGG